MQILLIYIITVVVVIVVVAITICASLHAVQMIALWEIWIAKLH